MQNRKSAWKEESEQPTAQYGTVLEKAGKLQTEKLFPYFTILTQAKDPKIFRTYVIIRSPSSAVTAKFT